MKIVVLDGYTLNPGDLSWKGFEALGECEIYEHTSSREFAERAKGADVLITNKTVIGADQIFSLPDLKYIGVLATGYNVVDIPAAIDRGVVVTNIPTYSTSSVAQMVFAHILNITQQVGLYAAEVKEKWPRSEDFCFWQSPLIELSGLRIGIVGFGHIGQAVARIAQAFDMEVCAYSSKKQEDLPQGIKKVSLEELFVVSDIITLHCPLTEETRGMVHAERLSTMKSRAILINTGRGPLVNETDLAYALNQEIIYAAGLDVLSQEPPATDNPLLQARNCFITPHIAWATGAARGRLMDQAVENLKSFLSGTIINNVAK
ncbi:MAG: D-2-hydroxyacid dehydrogenase [Bacteroides sp.]|nr:D-2-hydroxyacid dehydrogenase [Bacteroides sp.]